MKSQSRGVFSCEWKFCFPRRHTELLPVMFHLFISALRLLPLQKLQHFLWELPPWPALTRLLQLDGALRSVAAQNLHLVRGKPAPGLFVPNSNHGEHGSGWKAGLKPPVSFGGEVWACIHICACRWCPGMSQIQHILAARVACHSGDHILLFPSAGLRPGQALLCRPIHTPSSAHSLPLGICGDSRSPSSAPTPFLDCGPRRWPSTLCCFSRWTEEVRRLMEQPPEARVSAERGAGVG